MTKLDGEQLDTVLSDLLGDERLDRSGEPELADGNVDGDLPRARHGQDELVRRLGEERSGLLVQLARRGQPPDPGVRVEQDPDCSKVSTMSSGSGALKSPTIALVRRARDNGATIVPILARPCHWESSDFGAAQPLPRNRKAISTWPHPDEAWLEIVHGIEQAVAQLQPTP